MQEAAVGGEDVAVDASRNFPPPLTFARPIH